MVSNPTVFPNNTLVMSNNMGAPSTLDVLSNPHRMRNVPLMILGRLPRLIYLNPLMQEEAFPGVYND
jgi:hypothetical protein